MPKGLLNLHDWSETSLIELLNQNGPKFYSGLQVFLNGNTLEISQWKAKNLNTNDATEQCVIGLMHWQEDDNCNAELYLKKSAEKGFEIGQLYLAKFYHFCNNKELEEKWLLEAAKANAIAQLSLAQMYSDTGRFDKAKIYYIKAAEHNSVDAMFALGKIFYEEDNLELSKKWYEKAADLGDSESQVQLGELFLQEGCFNKAKYWLEKAAKQGYKLADKAFATEGNFHKIRKWVSKARANKIIKHIFDLCR